jgi:hypothetical protein
MRQDCGPLLSNIACSISLSALSGTVAVPGLPEDDQAIPPLSFPVTRLRRRTPGFKFLRASDAAISGKLDITGCFSAIGWMFSSENSK